MIKKDNYRISKKVHHHDLSYSTTIAALFSVILILSAGGTQSYAWPLQNDIREGW